MLTARVRGVMLDIMRLGTYGMRIGIGVSVKHDKAFCVGNETVDERSYRIKGETVPECIEKALNYSKISTK